MVAPVAASAFVRSSMKVGDAEFDHLLGADVVQDRFLFGAADDVDQGDAVLEADLVEHLAEIGGGGGVNQRGMPLAPHGLGHGERGQRVDEPRRAVGRRRAFGQHLAVGGPQAAILRIHGAADHRHGLAQQRLCRCARLDDDARAFVADRHRLIETRGKPLQRLLRHRCGDHRAVARARQSLRSPCRPARAAGRDRTD